MRERPTVFPRWPRHRSFWLEEGALPAARREDTARVLRPARPGPLDARNPKQYALDENVEDLEALRVYLGLGSIVSIGASHGGRVAMAHAARYP